MTAYLYKIILIVPRARVTAFNAWLKSSFDPSGADWLRIVDPAPGVEPVGLSPDGGDTPTHAWCNAHLTAAQKAKLDTYLADKPDVEVKTADNAAGEQAEITADDGLTFGLAGTDERLFPVFDNGFSNGFS